MSDTSLERARTAKKEALQRFRKMESLTGVGITRVRGGYAIKLNVSSPIQIARLPTAIHGVPIQVEVTGRIRPR